jgi:hypothetical protein
VRTRKINITYNRIASTASWFETRGRSVNRLIERLKIEKNVNIFNHQNETPLIIASQLRAYRFAILILTQKTSINIQDEKGYSALHYAIGANTLKLVLELLKKWRRRERTYKKGTPHAYCGPTLQHRNWESIKEKSIYRLFDIEQ